MSSCYFKFQEQTIPLLSSELDVDAIKLKVKAIIFDIDGTLIDSLDVIAETLVEASKEIGYNIGSEDIKEFIGIPGKEIVKQLLKISDPQKIREVLEKWEEKQRKIYLKRVKLYPKVKETLEYLKKRGFKLATATSLTSDKAKEILQIFSIKRYFDTCVAADDVKEGKPSPHVFLEAAKRLNVKPEECIVVGDTEYNILAAKKAKMKVIMFGSQKQKFKIIKTKPDHIIHSYQELKTLLPYNFNEKC